MQDSKLYKNMHRYTTWVHERTAQKTHTEAEVQQRAAAAKTKAREEETRKTHEASRNAISDDKTKVKAKTKNKDIMENKIDDIVKANLENITDNITYNIIT